MTKVTVKALTGPDLVARAAGMTTRGKSIKASLRRWYKSEHSPIRVRLFWIELEAIPTFVSVHLVRHKHGVEHFVLSNREDRGGGPAEEVTRLTPVNHAMLINAQALINMSRKRLCFNASTETVGTWTKVRKAVRSLDPDLAAFMVPECVYRNGTCPEFRQCAVGLSSVLKAYKEK